jgi:hypothetical protein
MLCTGSLLILDWTFMRERPAMHLLHELQADPATAHLSAIVTSAASMRLQEQESTLLAQGIAVLYKPYGIGEISACIERQLRGD